MFWLNVRRWREFFGEVWHILRFATAPAKIAKTTNKKKHCLENAVTSSRVFENVYYVFASPIREPADRISLDTSLASTLATVSGLGMAALRITKSSC